MPRSSATSLPVAASYLAVDRTRGLIQSRITDVADDRAHPGRRHRRRDAAPARRRRPARAGRGQRVRLLRGARPVPARSLGERRRWPVTRPRCASTAGASTARRPSTPPHATRRARASSRPAPARARPGCWSRACCARCSTARRRTRSWRSPSRAPPQARCASASTSGSPTSPRRARRTSSASRALVERGVDAGARRGARARARHAAGPRARSRTAGRDPHLPRLVRAAAARRTARAARPARRPGRRRARSRTGASTAPAVHPRLPRRAAARRRPCVPITRAATARAAGISFASGSTRSGTGGWSSSSPTRPACSTTSVEPRRGRLARARSLRASRRVDRDRGVDRPSARRGARAGLGARQAGARCGRRACRGALPGAEGALRLPRGPRSSRRPTTSRAQLARGLPLVEQVQDELRAWAIRSTSTNRTRSICAWSASAARCSPRSPTTSARKASPTWPTSSAVALALLRDGELSGWVQERLDARVAPPADRRVPGHEPAAMARAARLAVGLRRRRRRRERSTPAGRLHRRRPEAEHLPIPPRRAARVRSGGEVRARRARRQRPGLRSHAPQRAAGDRGDQRRVRRAAGERVPGLSPAHDRARRRRRERGVDAAAHRPPAASAVAPRRRREPLVWRDSLTDAATGRRRGAARARGRGGRRGRDGGDRGRHARRRDLRALPQAPVAPPRRPRARARATSAIRRWRTPCWPRPRKRRT